MTVVLGDGLGVDEVAAERDFRSHGNRLVFKPKNEPLRTLLITSPHRKHTRCCVQEAVKAGRQENKALDLLSSVVEPPRRRSGFRYC